MSSCVARNLGIAPLSLLRENTRMRDGATAKTSTRRAVDARWTRLAIPLVVAALTVAAFLPVLRNGFVSWDDDKNLVENPHFRGLGLEQLRWMWTTFHM